jgi:hypothetical protein
MRIGPLAVEGTDHPAALHDLHLALLDEAPRRHPGWFHQRPPVRLLDGSALGRHRVPHGLGGRRLPGW